MREIRLNNTQYRITDDPITKRSINPWKAPIVGGSKEYSSFQQSDMEEWHDFRNGIGIESALPNESAKAWWMEGVDVSSARSTILGPLVTTAGSFGVAQVRLIDFGGKTYGVGHNLIAEWNTGTSAWDSKHTGLANPVDATVMRDSTDEYLVVSSASTAVYSIDGTSWSALTGCQGYLSPFAGRLNSIDTDGSTLRYSPVNNIDGSWQTFPLSEDTGTVYRLFSGKLLADSTPALYFTSTKGLFSIDITNEICYRQEINYPPLTNAGRVGMYYNANIWVASGGGLIKVAPSRATPIGPDLDDGLPSGYQGDIFDMKGVGNWIVFCVNGGSSDKSSILKRNMSLGGNLQVYTTSSSNNAIACIHHSPSSMYTNGRLWWGESTGIKYCMFPDTTSNPKQVSTYEYVAASASQGLILPRFRRLAAISKVALRATAITLDCNATEYITLYYRIDDTSGWTELGTYKASPRPTALEFNSGLGVKFYTIQFAVKLQRGGTIIKSPQLESLMLAGYAWTERISAWTFRVNCIGEDGAKTFADFEAIRDTATLVTFYPSGDSAKSSYNVKLTHMPDKEWFENQGAKQGWMEVTLEEIFNG